MRSLIRISALAAAVLAAVALSAALIQNSSRPPARLETGFVSQDRAIQAVVAELARFLGTRRGRTRIALLEEDVFEHAALPAMQPEEINARLCAAAEKAGLTRVSFTAGKEAAVKTVRFLKTFDSAIYAESFLDKLGHAEEPDARLTCKVLRLSDSSDKVQLECSLLDLAREIYPWSAAQEFTDPRAVRRAQAAQDSYAALQTRLERAVRLAGSAGAALGLVALGAWGYFLRERARCLAQTPYVVAQIEQLLKQQSYHAAQRQLDRCLEYMPEDARFESLKDRLEALLADYGGDPRLAERVALKVRTMEVGFQGGKVPHPEELRRLAALPGSPAKDLLARIQEVKQLESDSERERRRADELRFNVKYLRDLIDQGRLIAAQGEARVAYRADPAPEVSKILAEIDDRLRNAAEDWAALRRRLCRGDLRGAAQAVEELLRLNGDHAEAKALAECFQPAAAARLRPRKVGREVVLLRGASFIVGRDPSRGATVLVADDTVGRSHARFTLLETQLIVEDLDSKNGTVVAGRKVAKAEIDDGDIVKLGPNAAFETHLVRGNDLYSPPRATRPAPAEDGRPSEKKAPNGSISGMLLEHPRVLVLWGRMGVSFSAAGLAPRRDSSIEFLFKDGILLFGRAGTFNLVLPGEVLEHGGIPYVFEPA